MKSEAVHGLANANWPVLVVDETGKVHHANAAATQVLGPAVAQSSAVLSSFWLADNELPLDDFLKHLAAGQSGMFSVKFLGIGNVSLPFQAYVCPVVDGMQRLHLLQLLPPPPEPKNASAESSAVHKQKLEFALQLARTVSLDFNNALTSILGYTSLILSKLEPDNPWRASLMEVEKSALKAAEIASDLGTFSRQEKESKVQMSGNLNQLLQRNVETFQAAKLDKEVKWQLQLERKLYTAKFDEAKMQQALLKIMENAVESLGQFGQVILSSRNIELTQPTQDRNAQLAAGAYVCAEITDNGCGIDVEVLPRIFEPFFTTKRASKHRGLGLAWVYGIVTNHGGGVAVSSQPGSGTSVRVYLPADKKFVREDHGGGADLSGDQTILMVDDEEILLTMGQTVLTAYGYKVLTASSGQKALDLISQGDQQIDLIITDLVMPGMGGRELIEQVQRVSPFTRVLCTSGYVRRGESQREAGYLQKPFTSQDLLVKVKHALSSDEPTPVD